MDVTVCGLPLAGDHDIMHPLAAVVCVKGLDDAGDVAYWPLATDGLSTIEAQGMALWLLDGLRKQLRGEL